MGDQKHLALLAQHPLQRFDLPQRHGLVLDQVQIDAVTEQSVHRDERYGASLLVLDIHYFDGVFGVGQGVHLVVRQVLIVARGRNHRHVESLGEFVLDQLPELHHCVCTFLPFVVCRVIPSYDSRVHLGHIAFNVL